MLSEAETDYILRALALLAARWRGNADNPQLSQQIVSHYNELLRFLLGTGWNDSNSNSIQLTDYQGYIVLKFAKNCQKIAVLEAKTPWPIL
jgi:hypothetical protein